RGARAALDEVGHELVTHLARDEPVTGAGDRVGDLGIEHLEVAVRQCGGLLHVAERLDEVRLQRHRDAGDVEVVAAPQCLHAVVGAIGKLLLAQEAFLDSWHGVSFRSVQASTSYFQPNLTILRRMKAIWACSGRSFGQTSWQASSDMQPNTPLSSPITS